MLMRDDQRTAAITVNRRRILKGLALGGAAVAAGALGPTSDVWPARARAQGAPVTLRYQNHWTKESDTHYKGMEWLYAGFKEKYPNITIDNILNPDGDASDQKIRADCAAGDCPDIVHDAGVDMWTAGYLLDLTSHVKDDADWLGVLDAGILDATTTDGHLWGLSAEFSPLSTIWNTRILDAAGVGAIPATWDELLDASEKIKAKGYLPTSWGVGGVHQWHNIVVGQAGGREALAAGQFDAPPIADAFGRLKTFVDNQWIPANEIELTWQQSVALFVAEKTAFYLNGAWTLGNEITGEGAAPDLKDVVKFSPYPAVGDGGTTVELKQTTAIGLAAALADQPDKLAAGLDFLKFWFSPEGGKQWILLTRSPMADKEDLASIDGVDPLLLAFLAPQQEATTAYTLPGTVAMQERGWDDCWSGLQALMAGKSVDEAVATYVDELSKYKTA